MENLKEHGYERYDVHSIYKHVYRDLYQKMVCDSHGTMYIVNAYITHARNVVVKTQFTIDGMTCNVELFHVDEIDAAEKVINDFWRRGADYYEKHDA